MSVAFVSDAAPIFGASSFDPGTLIAQAEPARGVVRAGLPQLGLERLQHAQRRCPIVLDHAAVGRSDTLEESRPSLPCSRDGRARSRLCEAGDRAEIEKQRGTLPRQARVRHGSEDIPQRLDVLTKDGV